MLDLTAPFAGGSLAGFFRKRGTLSDCQEYVVVSAPRSLTLRACSVLAFQNQG